MDISSIQDFRWIFHGNSCLPNSFLMFSGKFLWLFKINFVTKSNKLKIFKKLYMNHFLAWNNIKREKYLKDSLFLKFFDILCNKPSRWIQKFAVGVTKLMPPDEIRRFDGSTITMGELHGDVRGLSYFYTTVFKSDTRLQTVLYSTFHRQQLFSRLNAWPWYSPAYAMIWTIGEPTIPSR